MTFSLLSFYFFLPLPVRQSQEVAVRGGKIDSRVNFAASYNISMTF